VGRLWGLVIPRYLNFGWCYNPKLGLDCNLGKNLSISRGDNQLIKHKNTGLYLQLYIPNDYEE